MRSYLDSLETAILPPCADTALLPPGKRRLNYHLDTGRLIDGAAFQNSVVSVDIAGGVTWRPAIMREFFSLARPFAFPEKDPGRPVLFDAWLEERVPDPVTRLAMWEAIGAVLLERLTPDQKGIWMKGDTGTGKGTIHSVLSMMVGEDHTMGASSPSELDASQFSLSEMDDVALLSMSDIPPMPTRQGPARDAYIKGVAKMKAILGRGAIGVEKKNKGRITIVTNVSLVADTNHDIKEILGGRDYRSWERRIILFPMNIELPDEQQVADFHETFRPEMQRIAWAAVHAYAASRHQGFYTQSPEMREMMAEMTDSQGLEGKLTDFIRTLPRVPGLRTQREHFKTPLASFLGETPDRALVTKLYNRLERTVGIGAPVKIHGYFCFKDVGLPVDPAVDPETGEILDTPTAASASVDSSPAETKGPLPETPPAPALEAQGGGQADVPDSHQDPADLVAATNGSNGHHGGPATSDGLGRRWDGEVPEMAEAPPEWAESADETAREAESADETAREAESTDETAREAESADETAREAESADETAREAESADETTREAEAPARKATRTPFTVAQTAPREASEPAQERQESDWDPFDDFQDIFPEASVRTAPTPPETKVAATKEETARETPETLVAAALPAGRDEWGRTQAQIEREERLATTPAGMRKLRAGPVKPWQTWRNQH